MAEEQLPIRFHIKGYVTDEVKQQEYNVGDWVVYQEELFKVEYEIGEQEVFGKKYYGYKLSYEIGGIKHG